MGNIWQIQEAKSKFSELVKQARTKGAQIVTHRGEKAVVVIPYKDYIHLVKTKGKLSEFLQKSPLSGSEIKAVRLKDLPRKPDL
jgi:prevent-host-death family protein